MKILKLAMLISFLFNSVAYPYENASNTLRPPMLGDKTNKERLESAGKLASGQNVGATDQKGQFNIQNYRPGWTFAGWGTAKSAIKKNITTTKDRKEALKLVRTFARKLAENKIDPYYTLRDAIPVLVKLARNMDELELFINLGIKLAENKINPYYTLRDDIQAVAEVTKTPQELEDICDMLFNLNIKLAENKINPYDTLCNAIPSEAKAAKNAEELKLFINLGIILAENKTSSVYALQRVIRAVTKVAKTTQKIKDICDTLFNLNIKLAENSASFYNLIVQSSKATGDSFEDFKEVCNDVIPKMASKMGEARAWNFIKAEHIRRVLELQRTYGDFEITYNYEYAPGDISGDMIDRAPSESCQIQVLPPYSTSTKLASGQTVEGNIKPPSVGHVEPVADAYAAIQKGDYDKAYELVMEGLLGEDYVVNIDTAIGVLRGLVVRYGAETDKGKEINEILEIVGKHKEATDQTQMKAELQRQYAIRTEKEGTTAIMKVDPRYLYAVISIDSKAPPIIREGGEAYRGFTKSGEKITDAAEMRKSLMTISQHIEEIEKEGYARTRLVAFIGNGNILSNPYFVQWRKGTLYFIDGEPINKRTYTSLVVWEDDRVSIEELKYESTGDGKWKYTVVGKDTKEDDPHIKYATFGQRIVKEGEAFDPKDIYEQFYDIRHILDLPHIGRGLYFGWGQLKQDNQKIPEAFEKAITLDFKFRGSESRDWEPEEINTKLQDKAGYKNVSYAANKRKDNLEPGEYIIEGDQIHIRLKEAIYPHNIIGVKKDGQVIVVQSHGLSGKTGTTLSEATKKLINEGAYNAIILDNGADVMMWKDKESKGYSGTDKGFIAKSDAFWKDNRDHTTSIVAFYLKVGTSKANLSNLKATQVLFLDTEVVANPDGFGKALEQLKTNEGNIPVVLLTEGTKESIMAKLSGIDLTGVQFRTKAELGLQDLEWNTDERVSLIDGIANLSCIPLTNALCETYKDLQKVRDQV